MVKLLNHEFSWDTISIVERPQKTPSTLGKNSGGRSMCISNLGWFGSREIAWNCRENPAVSWPCGGRESFIPGIWEQIWNVLWTVMKYRNWKLYGVHSISMNLKTTLNLQGLWEPVGLQLPFQTADVHWFSATSADAHGDQNWPQGQFYSTCQSCWYFPCMPNDTKPSLLMHRTHLRTEFMTNPQDRPLHAHSLSGRACIDFSVEASELYNRQCCINSSTKIVMQLHQFFYPQSRWRKTCKRHNNRWPSSMSVCTGLPVKKTYTSQTETPANMQLRLHMLDTCH